MWVYNTYPRGIYSNQLTAPVYIVMECYPTPGITTDCLKGWLVVITHTRRKWDKVTGCYLTPVCLTPKSADITIWKEKSLIDWKKACNKVHISRAKNTNMRESSWKKFSKSDTRNGQPTQKHTLWLWTICLMKRKEPRISVAEATYYQDDGNKGKQETFSEGWKQKISLGFSDKGKRKKR